MRYLDPEEFMARRLAGRQRPAWRVAVVCFINLRISEILINRLHASPLRQSFVGGMDQPGDRPYVYEAVVGGNSIALVSGCWWGGPQAAIVVEDLACLGVDHIIGFGAAGSISRDLPKYSHIVATTGLVTDGTSRGYTRDREVNADAGLLAMVNGMSGLRRPIVPVKIATVDALYQETEAAVRQWASLGARAINMETTPLYAVSRSRGVRSLWLGYVSDCLTSDAWDNWFDEPRSVTEDAAETAAALVETVVSHIK